MLRFTQHDKFWFLSLVLGKRIAVELEGAVGKAALQTDRIRGRSLEESPQQRELGAEHVSLSDARQRPAGVRLRAVRRRVEIGPRRVEVPGRGLGRAFLNFLPRPQKSA